MGMDMIRDTEIETRTDIDVDVDMAAPSSVIGVLQSALLTS